MRGHKGRVNRVAWAPGGARLATSCWDGRLRVFDATQGPYALLLEVEQGDMLRAVRAETTDTERRCVVG